MSARWRRCTGGTSMCGRSGCTTGRIGHYPGSMEQLEKTNNMRFLRQQYVDPMTGKADWRLIHVGEAKTTVKGFFGQPLSGAGSGVGVGGGVGFAGAWVGRRDSRVRGLAGSSRPGRAGLGVRRRGRGGVWVFVRDEWVWKFECVWVAVRRELAALGGEFVDEWDGSTRVRVRRVRWVRRVGLRASVGE